MHIISPEREPLTRKEPCSAWGIKSVVQDILPWIEDNLDNERIRVSTVTRKSGYGHSHFQRVFRKQTGYNLAEYIRTRRLIRAAQSLLFTDKDIMQIAFDNGFTSQQTFSRTFRKYLNVPPATFRKRHARRAQQPRNSVIFAWRCLSGAEQRRFTC
ncbi:MULTISPECIES: helix-turn-helix domain-containing protein [Erwiniaceae]|uniref:HTH araC/xylS-type domain-containing protein n=1 Tax=Pantoea coffeiphila TaxID=1465635 RepID=A0A2S9IF41_9GAMM|nr:MULTISPECIES: helix-turn-helix domain-containing protein [Erwiniaceae]MCW1873010.1 helix-turn-helix domain-containing protein [Erwinia sp. INIA01]PRD16407.1 hypothetical protein CQW29_06245 [Pantoea coffeiphila]